jgi:hypothetical protein
MRDLPPEVELLHVLAGAHEIARKVPRFPTTGRGRQSSRRSTTRVFEITVEVPPAVSADHCIVKLHCAKCLLADRAYSPPLTARHGQAHAAHEGTERQIDGARFHPLDKDQARLRAIRNANPSPLKRYYDAFASLGAPDGRCALCIRYKTCTNV